MDKHTKEPWREGRSGCVVSDDAAPGVGGSDDVVFYGGHLICESVNEGNRRRIVACVNACEGMSNEELDGGILLGVMEKRIAALEQQCDALLAALEAITGWSEDAIVCMREVIGSAKSLKQMEDCGIIPSEIASARAAIAKAKGV